MRNVLVWGAAGGIGQAITQNLADNGDTVVAIARSTDELRAITIYTIEANIADAGSVATAMEQATAVSEMFDLMVFTAGDITSSKIVDMPSATWRRIIDNNLTTAFLAVQASLPHLAPGAPIVLIGAVHERLRLPGLAAYAITKAGIEVFADVLRKETRRKVMVVRPGAVATNLWKKVPFALPKGALGAADLATQIIGAIAEGRDGVIDV